MEEYNDRDAIVSIRSSLEEERQELLQKLESIYAQIDLERDVRKQTIKLGLTQIQDYFGAYNQYRGRRE
ncbi:hypothetical protein BASA81_014647 [Batrachochytrium salamandrivorans]|nr:hypothetical protein BASA81_014647 [Batrachochytrium salamandrivorans]